MCDRPFLPNPEEINFTDIGNQFIDHIGHIWEHNCKKYYDEPHLQVTKEEIELNGFDQYDGFGHGYYKINKNISPRNENSSFKPHKTFPFMPMGGPNLVKLLYAASRARRYRSENNFIDAGAGPGFVLELAKMIGFNDCQGVELNPVHVEYEIKKQLNIHLSDMMEFDYKPFSVIYSYIPFRPFNLFTDKVMQEAEVGTIFIWCGGSFKMPERGEYVKIYGKAHEHYEKDGIVIKKVAK